MTIALGALLDGVPETAVLGLTVLQTGEIGVAVLVAVFVSNVPEAIAATASLWVAIAVISAVASALGYMFLDGASAHVIAFMYAFAGGAILTMLSTSMMPEAYENVGPLAGIPTVLGGTVAFTITWIQGI